jgi:hypothetical protein
MQIGAVRPAVADDSSSRPSPSKSP